MGSTPGEHLVALSPTEWSFEQALGEAWMPPGGEPAISGAEAGVGGYVDQVVETMPQVQAKLFKVLLHLLDDATLPSHFTRFQQLELDARIEVLRGWVNHGNPLIRQATGAVLVLAAIGYTSHPEAAEAFRPQFRCGFNT